MAKTTKFSDKKSLVSVSVETKNFKKKIEFLIMEKCLSYSFIVWKKCLFCYFHTLNFSQKSPGPNALNFFDINKFQVH